MDYVGNRERIGSCTDDRHRQTRLPSFVAKRGLKDLRAVWQCPRTLDGWVRNDRSSLIEHGDLGAHLSRSHRHFDSWHLETVDGTCSSTPGTTDCDGVRKHFAAGWIECVAGLRDSRHGEGECPGLGRMERELSAESGPRDGVLIECGAVWHRPDAMDDSRTDTTSLLIGHLDNGRHVFCL